MDSGADEPDLVEQTYSSDHGDGFLVQTDAAFQDPTHRSDGRSKRSRSSTNSSSGEPTCRVCRSEGAQSQPLYHPCKCSGSIRFVHQDCLIEWLKHSKKSHCELCGFRFVFTKVYAPEMPTAVPAPLFFAHSFSRFLRVICFILRLALITFVWLLWIPWCTRWIWRFFFWVSDRQWIVLYNGRNGNLSISVNSLNSATSLPATNGLWTASDSPRSIGDAAIAGGYIQPFWHGYGRFDGKFIERLTADCFQGLVIAGCLTVISIVIFLVREWVLQNAVGVAIDVVREDRWGQAGENVVNPEALLPHILEEINAGQEMEEDFELILPRGEEHEEGDHDHEERDFNGLEGNGEIRAIRGAHGFEQEAQRLARDALRLEQDAQRLRQMQNEVDLQEDLVGEDMDGLLELLGMQGPLAALFHHALFTLFYLTSSIALGVCLPYIFGRTMLLILLQPALFFYKLPVVVTRVVTDRLFHTLIISSKIVAYWISSFLEAAIQRIKFNATRYIISCILSFLTNLKLDRISISPEMYTQDAINHLQLLLKDMFRPTTLLPTTVVHRFWAIALGYVCLSVCGALYLSMRQQPTSTMERVLKEILRQAGTILRIIGIIGIELIIFPVFCGVLLDISLLPLWAGINMTSRFAFSQSHPLISSFLYWFAGALYMFHLSLFVGTLREILRPGVLYMIRDANDPNFQPIKDIVERGALAQLRKILNSGLMYLLLIVVTMFIPTWLLKWSTGNAIFPLRWTANEPIFEFPLDLMILHILLPLTTRSLNTANLLKNCWQWWIEISAKRLYLSNFLLGKDTDEEIEGQASIKLIPRPLTETDIQHHRLASWGYLRVPATDSISYSSRTDQYVNDVNKDNRRLDGTEPDLTRDDPNFTIVLRPPRYKLRLFYFGILFLLFGIISSLLVALIPRTFSDPFEFSNVLVLIGRYIFKSVLQVSVRMHDLYAYTLGLYAITLTCYMLKIVFSRRINQLIEAVKICGKSSSLWAVWLLKNTLFAVLGLICIIILPYLLALNLQLYLFFPLQKILYPETGLELHLVHDWAMGLLIWRILWIAYEMHNGEGIIWNNMAHQNDQRPMDLIREGVNLSTFWTLAQIGVFLLILLLIPPTFIIFIKKVISSLDLDLSVQPFIDYLNSPAAFQNAYAFLFCCGIFAASLNFLKISIEKLQAQVKDEVYLVGEVLHNLNNNVS